MALTSHLMRKNMSIYNRLKEIREYFNESQNKFSGRFDINQSTYSRYEKGRPIPDELKLQLLQLGININWLLSGEGRMFINEDEIQNLDNKIANNNQIQEKQSWIDAHGQVTTISVSKDSFSVPILKNKVSAGPGEEWDLEDFSEERLPILKRFVRRFPKEKLFAAEVRGDSMTGVQLFDGDLVVFVHNLIEGDGIYVISVDGELLVKRLEFDHFDKKLIIKSENPRYEVKVVDPERAQILGKVVGWLHHHPY
jgi:phage repressor protein C with HTH and peptisase S24 domain